MSANEAVRDALIALIAADPVLGAIERREPVGTLPRLSVTVTQAADAGAKGLAGREVRTAMTIGVAKGQTARLSALVAAAEAVGEALAGDLGGWRVGAASLSRTRVSETRDGATATVEHRIRVFGE